MSILCTVPLLLSFAPAAWPAARGEEAAASGSASVISRSFGAFEIDGETGAAGPDYAARFVGGGIEFKPALGDAAPRSYPVAFALESIRRGDLVILEAPPSAFPEREGNLVRYARGQGISECYEARLDGVEQSFRFESRPEGEGDLIVRGRVTTDLPASDREGADEALRFELPGLGGVTWGAVTGIDAGGSRVEGGLRFDGTHLELTLPGEFIDRAVFPLVLDPLIGSRIVISGSGAHYQPDVAYDATHDRYLVVWYRRYSSTNRAVFGQRFYPTGVLSGPLITITPTNGNYYSPCVANVNASDRFLVAYTDSTSNPSYDQVWARAVYPYHSSMSSAVQMYSPAYETGADVGGDSGGSTTAFVVAANALSGSIVVVRATVPPSGDPTRDPITLVAGFPDAPAVSITKHGGANGRFLVAWKGLTASGNHDVHARVIDLAGTFVTGATPVSVDGVADETLPDCATQDGTEFAVVYEKHASGTSGYGDIACRTASFGSGALAVSSENILAGGTFLDQVQPAIDFAASKYLVAWAQFAVIGGGWSLRMVGIDPNGCVPCEPVSTLDSSSTAFVWSPKIGAQSSGSPAAGDQAAVVWESAVDVLVQLAEAIGAGGAVTPLGAGCGGGGTAGVNGPVAIGNASFAFTLSGAGGPAVGLALGVSQLNWACGGCTLVPTLDFFLPPPAPLSFPIPCNVGLLGTTAYAQWVVAAPGSCPVFPALSLSDAISVVIGQ